MSEQGHPKAPPAMKNASQKSSVGDKNKEVRWGQNLPFCFQGK